MWKMISGQSPAEGEMGAAFANALVKITNTNRRIVAMDADLADASRFSIIKKKVPGQFIEMGIAEANMIGVAAGMSIRGFIPFVHSFAPFVTRRVMDQVFMAGAYSHNTVNIYGSDPGVCAAANGGTHSSYEDVALFRSIPEAMIFDPADTVQLEWLVDRLAEMKGVHYIRANRKGVPQIYETGSTFEIGKGNILVNGTEAVIFTAGILLRDALDAAKMLGEKGISVAVVDLFTIKPLDVPLVRNCVEGKKLAVTFENHSIYGGLGSAVAEVMAECAQAVPLRRIGVQDRFGQVGPVEYLKETFGLTAKHLEREIEQALRQR